MTELTPELVERARRGDPAAFEALVRATQARVYALAWRLTYDAELARDVTQEVYVRLYQQLGRYDPTRPFEPWFLTLATRLALNARAKARLRRADSLDAPVGEEGRSRETADPGAPPAGQAAADEEARAGIRRAIAELPEAYAGVVALYYLEGLSVRELAERLELPEGTVKIRLHRARNLLRARLERFTR